MKYASYSFIQFTDRILSKTGPRTESYGMPWEMSLLDDSDLLISPVLTI